MNGIMKATFPSIVSIPTSIVPDMVETIKDSPLIESTRTRFFSSLIVAIASSPAAGSPPGTIATSELVALPKGRSGPTSGCSKANTLVAFSPPTINKIPSTDPAITNQLRFSGLFMFVAFAFGFSLPRFGGETRLVFAVLAQKLRPLLVGLFFLVGLLTANLGLGRFDLAKNRPRTETRFCFLARVLEDTFGLAGFGCVFGFGFDFDLAKNRPRTETRFGFLARVLEDTFGLEVFGFGFGLGLGFDSDFANNRLRTETGLFLEAFFFRAVKMLFVFETLGLSTSRGICSATSRASSDCCDEAPISIRTEFSSGAPLPRQVAISIMVSGFSFPNEIF